MTVQTQENRVNYISDGVETTYGFTFEVLDEDWMNVYEDEELTSLAYDVNLNADQDNTPGGDIVFTAGVPDDQVAITIQRIVDLTQEIDYTTYDGFPAETHEAGLDKGILIDQQLQDEVDRSLKAGVSTPEGVNYELPFPDAGKAIIWNQAEDGFENSDEEVNGITADAQASADDSAASANQSGVFASNSSGFADNSEASSQKAQEWATNPEDDPVETGPDEFSAFHWAKKAEAFVTVPEGTVMLFRQELAPAGWTKLVDQDDKVLRIVSGALDDGGSLPFSTVFAREATDGHTLTAAQSGSPAHSHTISNVCMAPGADFSPDGISIFPINQRTSGVTNNSTAVAAANAHTHPMDMRVEYVDIIFCSKDAV